MVFLLLVLYLKGINNNKLSLKQKPFLFPERVLNSYSLKEKLTTKPQMAQ